MAAIIKTENLSFSYETGENLRVEALRDVNISIEEGSFVAVLGHNGSGKSTFAKLLNGILRPSAGDVWVSGMNTKEDALLLDIRKTVGMVFQNPDNQIVATTVEEDVAFALENMGVPSDEIRKRVDQTLETMGLTEYKRHAPHKLSGGQKQRVAIAGVIAMRPSCLVMDEPTAMLDPSGRDDIMRAIKTLNRDYEKTIVLITHYMSEAAQADRVIVMSNGSVYMDGAPREVFSDVESLKGAKLRAPQTVNLLHELNRVLPVSLPEDALDEHECAKILLDFLRV